MSRRQQTLAEILAASGNAQRSSTYHTFPGIVIAFYAADGTADIQPAVNDVRFDADTEARYSEPAQIIPHVRVMYPAGGGCSITWPLVAGDKVTLHAYDLDPTVHRQTGRVEDPQDVRRHGGSYWQAVPGDVTDAGPSAIPAGLVITAGSIVLGAGATDYVALASLVKNEFASFATWVKTGAAPSGGGPVTYATPAPTDSVASTLVKSK